MFDSLPCQLLWWERPVTGDAVRALLRGDTDLYEVDYRLRSADAECLWCEDRALVSERHPDGTPLRLRGVTLSLGHQRDESASEAAIVAALRQSFPEPGTEDPAMFCVQCERLGYPPDRWIAMDVGLDGGFPTNARPTLCGDCISRLYPRTADRILSRLQLSRQGVTRVANFSSTRLERQVLDSLLAHEPSIDLVASFDATDEPPTGLREHDIDIAVVCTESEGEYLMDLVRALASNSGDVPILGYCLCHQHTFADRTLHAGARGFVDATGSIGELVRAIHAVAAGGYHVSRTTTEWLRTSEHKPWKEPHTRLSDREFQVFLMTARQKSSAEIARALNISQSTVAKHRLHVVSKLDLTSSCEIARYAKQHRLID